MYSITKGMPEVSTSIMKSRRPGAFGGVSVKPICLTYYNRNANCVTYANCILEQAIFGVLLSVFQAGKGEVTWILGTLDTF